MAVRLREGRDILAEAMAMDSEGVEAYENLSRRKRAKARSHFLSETRYMAIADRQSSVQQQIDRMHDTIRRLTEERVGHEVPAQRFKNGQSVLQWWAPWMKNAQETPATYNKKNRPAWFSAEVCSFRGFESIRQACFSMCRVTGVIQADPTHPTPL